MTKSIDDGLTDKQRAFALEYLTDYNGARAAIAAGYAEDSAKVKASQLLTLVNLRQFIQKRIHERIEAADIDATYILKELYQCWEADIADIIDGETGALLPVSDWPKIWRKLASGIKVKETRLDYGMGDLGEEAERTGAVIDVIIAKKDRFLELLGKHVNVKAFQENVAVDVTITDMSSKLTAARKRMNQELPSEN